MSPTRRAACLAAPALLAALGTAWAFTRGGHDFDVFYTAWKTVLAGGGPQIYVEGPDRYLYAPGFAWLLAPFAAIPRGPALLIWCLLKTAALAFAFTRVASLLRGSRAYLFAALGALLVARPLLIDFQYGQVNVFILAAALWALTRHLSSEKPRALDSLAWAALAAVAVAKIFPLPCLLVPLAQKNAKTPRALAGIAIGLALILLAPVATLGLAGALALYPLWFGALVAKGLPTDSHNQSFPALLQHYFTGNPTHVISQGMVPVQLGGFTLEPATIQWLDWAWTLGACGFLLAWILSARAQRAPFAWISVLIAGLIVPSHLVWKPYFLLALPAAAVAAEGARTKARVAVLVAAFLAINFSGFDFLGAEWGGRLESASIFLFAHLAITALAAWPSRDPASFSPPAR